MNNISILISKYLSHTISAAEQAELDKALELNPALHAELQEEVAIHNLYVEKDIMNRGANFRQFLNEKHTANSKRKKTIIASAAAVVIGVIAFGFWYANSDTNPETTTISDKKQQTIEQQSSNNVTKTINHQQSSNTTTKTPIVSTIQKAHVSSVNPATSDKPVINNAVTNQNETSKTTITKLNSLYTISNGTQTTTTLTLLDICKDYNPKVKVKTAKSQLEKETGKIELHTSVKGLLFSINGQDYQPETTFEDLAPASYTLWIKNENNCINTMSDIKVIATLCTKEYQNSFTPLVEPNWVVPIHENEIFSVTILNSSHVIVLESNSKITNKPVWNGMDMYNNTIPDGLYKAIVEYYGKETCVYNVTIIK